MLNFIAKHKKELSAGLGVCKSLAHGVLAPELVAVGIEYGRKAIAQPKAGSATPTSLIFEELYAEIADTPVKVIQTNADGSEEILEETLEAKYDKNWMSSGGWPLALVRIRQEQMFCSMAPTGQEIIVLPNGRDNIVLFRKFAGRHYIGYCVSSTVASQFKIPQNGIVDSNPAHPLYRILMGMKAPTAAQN